MATLKTTGLDETIEEMERMGQLTGQVADAMLMVGAAWIAQGLEQAARREGHEDTGELIASIGYPASPKKVQDVPTIQVYARGTDPDGVPNEDKAFVNEYGTTKIDPTEWWTEGEKEAEPKAVAGMIGVWSEFIQTGRVPQVSGPGKYRKKRRT